MGTVAQRCKFLGGVAGTLVGPDQLTARACLAGLIHLTDFNVGNLVVWPDLNYVVLGFQGHRHLRPAGSHADLWAEFGAVVARRPFGTVSVKKLKGHVRDEDARATDLDCQLWAGNLFADALAAAQARKHEVTPDQVVLSRAPAPKRVLS